MDSSDNLRCIRKSAADPQGMGMQPDASTSFSAALHATAAITHSSRVAPSLAAAGSPLNHSGVFVVVVLLALAERQLRHDATVLDEDVLEPPARE